MAMKTQIVTITGFGGSARDAKARASHRERNVYNPESDRWEIVCATCGLMGQYFVPPDHRKAKGVTYQ